MIYIDVNNNGQQIAYITVEKTVQNPTIKGHDFEISLFDSEHPNDALAVMVTHNVEDGYLALLKKAFTKLEESQKE